MSNVVILPCTTKLDLSPERVLDAAKDQLETVVILGWDKDGKEYFASSCSDGADVVWLLERLKLQLLRTVDKATETP